MTATEIAEYYADLLILQYRAKTKAHDTIKALVKPVVADKIDIQVRDAFSVSGAVGAQLDILAKYVGADRDAQNFSGDVSLTDDQLRLLILALIDKNVMGHSLYDIQALLAEHFNLSLFCFDHSGLRISYFLDSDSANAEIAEIFVASGFLPRPLGVQLGETINLPSIDDFFGFADTDGNNVNTTGFCLAADGLSGRTLVEGDFV